MLRSFPYLTVAVMVTAFAAFMYSPELTTLADSFSTAKLSAFASAIHNSSRPDLYANFARPAESKGRGASMQGVGDQIEVYFGAGCFWHVQHEVIAAEKRLLKRPEREATALTGYAGGTKIGENGKVCYHNAQKDSDYGSLGHSEAVAVQIPASKFPDFAKEFFDLLVDGERADPQDVGAEYRSILGIPGGVDGELFLIAKAAATKKGLRLDEGKGDDPDTLGTKGVFVYDSAKFPFHRAEVYHQYRDDMVWKYGAEYNALRREHAASGKIRSTGCPEKDT